MDLIVHTVIGVEPGSLEGGGGFMVWEFFLSLCI